MSTDNLNGKSRFARRRWLAGTALATTMAIWGVAQPALATPINLMGYTGPLSIHFTNYESFGNTSEGRITTGSTNFGIFEITSIFAGVGGSLPVGTPLYSPGGSNGFLVGTFDNITVSGVFPTSTGFFTENTGGDFAVYQVPTLPNFGLGTSAFTIGGCQNGAGCFTGISSGEYQLGWNLVPGADLIDPNSTLHATISAVTVPTSGGANGFGDIGGGDSASEIGKKGFTTDDLTKADLTIRDEFCSNTGSPTANCSGQPTGVGNWNEVSNDPVRTNAVRAVPEPASLALLGAGLGLLGFGAMRRRLRHKA